MRTQPTTALLWDIDGTLINTTAIIVTALGQVFREYLGLHVPIHKLRALIGIPVEEQMRAFGDPADYGANPQEMQEAVIRNYERHRSGERPIPEAIDALIEGKRRGLKTALVTSKNDVELSHTLPRLGISAYCDAIVGADQVAPLYKPHPRPVQLALDLLGISTPSDAIFIGDSVHDMHAGKAAGVRIVAVTWGAAPAEALRAEDPDYTFDEPHELLAFVRDELEAQAAA
jgi:pyrophosphatase PpaX